MFRAESALRLTTGMASKPLPYVSSSTARTQGAVHTLAYLIGPNYLGHYDISPSHETCLKVSIRRGWNALGSQNMTYRSLRVYLLAVRATSTVPESIYASIHTSNGIRWIRAKPSTVHVLGSRSFEILPLMSKDTDPSARLCTIRCCGHEKAMQ